MLTTNMRDARDAGVLIGPYHFAWPVDNPDAAEEAQHFLDEAAPYLQAGYLRPVLDLETGAGLGKDALSAWVHQWMNTVTTQTGIEPIIYVNSNYAINYLDPSIADYDLWIANWTYDLGASPNTGIWDTWNFWQYSNHGSVPGISGNVDLDVFNGNTSRLQQFVIGQLSINDVQRSEGNRGTKNFNFTVSLSSASSRAVTLDYQTAGGTATAGSDYLARSGTLTIPAGQISATISVPVIGDTMVEPNETFYVNLSGSRGATIADAQGRGTIRNDDTSPAQVVGRYVFYDNSNWDNPGVVPDRSDDTAIATDKTALRPGQTATLANYTSYSRGINGIMVDIADPAGAITDADFEFRVGNDNDPGGWPALEAAPTITVRPGEGVEGSDRATIIFPDNEIQKQWLQATVLANGNTGLEEPDVFYFGNAIGEAGNSASDAKVNIQDILATRSNPHAFWDPAEISNPYDHDRDQRVDATDVLIARANQTWSLTMLKLIDLSGGKAPSAATRLSIGKSAIVLDAVLKRASGQESNGWETPLGKLNWLYEFEQPIPPQRSSTTERPAEEAVDKLLGARLE